MKSHPRNVVLITIFLMIPSFALAARNIPDPIWSYLDIRATEDVSVMTCPLCDGYSLNQIDSDVDYEWRDFLVRLGAFTGPLSVNLRSKDQVEEFMGLFKGFKGSFL